MWNQLYKGQVANIHCSASDMTSFKERKIGFLSSWPNLIRLYCDLVNLTIKSKEIKTDTNVATNAMSFTVGILDKEDDSGGGIKVQSCSCFFAGRSCELLAQWFPNCGF